MPQLPRKLGFNTGRMYGPDDQPVTVVITWDRCYFRDHARNIDASFACDGWMLADRSEPDISTIVMLIYDHGTAAGLRYESTYDLDNLIKE